MLRQQGLGIFFCWGILGSFFVSIIASIIWLVPIILNPSQELITQKVSQFVCPEAVYAFDKRGQGREFDQAPSGEGVGDGVWGNSSENGFTNEKFVALTIDDGPDLRAIPENNSSETTGNSTWKILNVLRKNDAKATFFIISEEQLAEREKDSEEKRDPLTERIVREGHEIANHLTYDKASILLGKQFEKELKIAHQRLNKYVEPQGNVTWFRPGAGWCTPEMQKIVEKHDYKTVLGSVWPYDTFGGIDSEFTTKFIEENIRPGSIIILHDGGQRGDHTVETLQKMLKKLKSQGYQFVTLSELNDKFEPVATPTAFRGIKEFFRTWLILIIGRLKEYLSSLEQWRILPSLEQISIVSILWLVSGGVMLWLGFQFNFLAWTVAEFSGTTPQAIFLIVQAVRIFFLPSAIEEIIMRGSLLPSAIEFSGNIINLDSSQYFQIIIALGIYVFYHLPFGYLIDKFNRRKKSLNEPKTGSNYLRSFSQPIFLVLAGILGFCCTCSYLISGSIWLPIIFHWMVVTVWILFLKGFSTLNPKVR